MRTFLAPALTDARPSSRSKARVVALAAAAGALALALVLLAPTLAATPVPDSVYRVVASHQQWGAGYGYLWGEPGQGGRLWLSILAGYAEFGFTLGGETTYYPLPNGTLVVDDWISPGGGRFVATHVEGLDPPLKAAEQYAATGGGRLAGWAITVYGHT